MRDYYSEFLEKKSENIPQSKVSKVSKGEIQPTARAFDTFDTEQSGVNPEKKSSGNSYHLNSKNEVVTVTTLNLEAESLTARLNSMIRAGAAFEVGADEFSFTVNDESNGGFLIHRESKTEALLNLDTMSKKSSDLEFLKTNKTAILCTLQQGLLADYLFKDSPELLAAFSVNVKELESILLEAGAEDAAAYFEAVRTVTAEWFVNELLTGN